jgi:hypothetical protein
VTAQRDLIGRVDADSVRVIRTRRMPRRPERTGYDGVAEGVGVGGAAHIWMMGSQRTLTTAAGVDVTVAVGVGDGVPVVVALRAGVPLAVAVRDATAVGVEVCAGVAVADVVAVGVACAEATDNRRAGSPSRT